MFELSIPALFLFLSCTGSNGPGLPCRRQLLGHVYLFRTVLDWSRNLVDTFSQMQRVE